MAINTAPSFIIPGGLIAVGDDFTIDIGEAIFVASDDSIFVVGSSLFFGPGSGDFSIVHLRPDGSLDAGFGTNGQVYTDISADFDQAMAITLQSDGKILVGGFSSTPSATTFDVVRYNANGTLDTAFDSDGRVQTPVDGVNSEVTGIAVQPSGKILLAGHSLGTTDEDFTVVRYLANGALDTTFGSGGILVTPVGIGDDDVRGITVAPDGSFFLGGTATTDHAGTPNDDFALVKYALDGALDSTFGGDGIVTIDFGPDQGEFGNALLRQPDGKIVIVGSTYDGVESDFAIARVDAAGNLDTTFDGDGRATVGFLANTDEEAEAVALQGDKLLVAGTVFGGPRNVGVARFNADGTLDTTFGTNGIVTASRIPGVTDDVAFGIAVQSDGKFVITGTTASSGGVDFLVGRFTADGAVDTTFGQIDTLDGIPVFHPYEGPILMDGDVHIFDAELAGAGNYGGATLTIHRTGGANATDFFASADPVLDPLSEGGSLVYAGSLVGDVITNSGGTLEILFNSGATQTDVDGVMRAIGVSLDAPVLPATVQYDWIFSDGDSLDPMQTVGVKTVAIDPNDAPSFSTVLPPITTDFYGGDDIAQALVVQPDGKLVLLGGVDSGVVGIGIDFGIARYNANGTLDSGFGSGGIQSTHLGNDQELAWSGAIAQPGNKILAVGESTDSSSLLGDFAIARYTSAGTLDATFGGGTGFVTTDFDGGDDAAQDVAVLSGGKILVVGLAEGLDYEFGLARYNADGTLDTTFNGDGKVMTDVGGDDDFAAAMAIQSDGKIVVAGDAFNGFDFDFALVRYNTDGTLDTSFGDFGVQLYDNGFEDSAADVKIDSAGRIVVAGYTQDGPQIDFAVLRFNALDGSLDTTFSGDGIFSADAGFGFDDDAHAVAFQSDGKIVVAGHAFNGLDEDFALMRLNTDGTLDTTFGGGDGKVTANLGIGDDFAYSLAILSDGTIVLGGESEQSFTGIDFAIARFNSDGSQSSASTLNGTPTYTENDVPVQLDADVQIFDRELSARGQFSGATLMVQRQGGANVRDIFSATPDVGPLVAGSDLTYLGTPVGTVVQNAGGTLVLSFNASATQANIDGVLRALMYSNASENPPASVQLDYTFNDGNSGDQGPGGAASITGSLTVSINAVDDEPSFTKGLDEVILTGQARTAVYWATDVTAGPQDEAGAQALNFIVDNDNHALFSVLPTISAAGTLSYTIAPGATGSALVSVQLHDDGGTANGGIDTSGIQTFTITAVAANPVSGGAGPHDIIGSAGVDTLIGDTDGDFLTGNAGGDALNGGGGLDFAVYDTSPSALFVNLTTPSQNTGHALGDTYVSIEGVVGSLFNDTLVGNNGANELRGLDGNDYLQARDGNDTLSGGLGSDQLEGGPGADSLDGGAGIDYAKYAYATAAVTVDLANPGANTGDAVGDTYVSIEGIIGSARDDTLFGDGQVNDIAALAGNDTVYGRDGNDNLQGMDGDDVLVGGAGADQLKGDAGSDFARYDGAGVLASLADTSQNTGDAVGDIYLSIEGLIGSDAADTLIGNGTANELRGQDGDDYLQGRGGVDALQGGNGNDRLEGGAGGDALNGGTGFDYAAYYYSGAFVIADLLTPSANFGEAFQDTYASIEGLIGSTHNDFLSGDNNANDLAGFEGIDNLLGRGGDDNLQGMDGDDILDGGAGQDRLAGGLGNDTFEFHIGEAAGDKVVDFNGNGAGIGDTLAFHGYGLDATFTQDDATHWTIHSNLFGGVSETIEFLNAPAIDVTFDVLIL